MSDVYKIESGVPIPRARRPNYMKRAEVIHDGYPFSSMNVGDSFYFEDASIKGRSSHWAAKTGAKFCTRAQRNGWRIWRVS